MHARDGSTLAGLLICAAATGLRAEPPASAPARLTPDQVTPASARLALDRAVRFLVGSQNPDGSWGGAADSLTTWSGWTWTNPESHRAWRVATTGLCGLALLESAADDPFAPLDRGLDYLIANANVKRPSDWDTMECWAHIYGLQALAAVYVHPHYAGDPRHDDIRQAAIVNLQHLAYTQSLSGGWGYLEFATPRTARPQWATSFTTAAGVVALAEAQAAGLPVDEAMFRRAARAVRRCRLPNGAYTYSVQAITHPRRIGSIDRINGSLGRIQVANLALRMAGEEVPLERLRTGLDHFFREHRFLDIAMHKPVPHEAYYQNSGYFYMFGHYYAARVIEHLPPEERRTAWPRLQYEVMKIQQADGSMWDYDMHAYDKPYGTAYGVMVLARSLRDGPA
jgi:hypothetical protein